MMLPPKKDLPDYYELIKVSYLKLTYKLLHELHHVAYMSENSTEDGTLKKLSENILFRDPLIFKRFEIASVKRITEILKI